MTDPILVENCQTSGERLISVLWREWKRRPSYGAARAMRPNSTNWEGSRDLRLMYQPGTSTDLRTSFQFVWEFRHLVIVFILHNCDYDNTGSRREHWSRCVDLKKALDAVRLNNCLILLFVILLTCIGKTFSFGKILQTSVNVSLDYCFCGISLAETRLHLVFFYLAQTKLTGFFVRSGFWSHCVRGRRENCFVATISSLFIVQSIPSSKHTHCAMEFFGRGHPDAERERQATVFTLLLQTGPQVSVDVLHSSCLSVMASCRMGSTFWLFAMLTDLSLACFYIHRKTSTKSEQRTSCIFAVTDHHLSARPLNSQSESDVASVSSQHLSCCT